VTTFEDVAAVEDLAEGEMLGVELSNGQPVCVLNHRGVISAVGNLCTHAMFHLSDGVLHADGSLECIWHGAKYDCRTGAVRRHPAEWPLPVHDVRIEGSRILVGAQPIESEEQAS
jgi:3-phenylpropionate/trans-cinnamate dioxygenase ferredoxin subunit